MSSNRMLVGIVLVLTAFGCAREERSSGGFEGRQMVPPAQAPEAEPAQLRASGYLDGGSRSSETAADAATPAAPTATTAPAGRGDALDAFWSQQKLIRDGRIEIEVASVEAAIARIGELAGVGKALVAGSEVRQGHDGRKSGTVTLKVPAGGFDGALAGLRELGKVRSESSTTQDVTKAYTDLETRLEVKRRTQERLEALLARQSGSLADLLQVERELERVVTEIERMLGEKRYYDQRIAVSTITVVLFEPGAAIRPNAFDPLRDAMKNALGVLATSLAALVYAVTSALPWVLLLWGLWILVRRARRRRRERLDRSESRPQATGPAGDERGDR